MSNKHTPTPWRIGAAPLVIKATCNGIVVAEVRGHDPRERGKARDENIEYCRGNAAFIVKAVNSHDALVAALREMMQSYEATLPDHCNAEWFDDYNRARAALDAAEAA